MGPRKPRGENYTFAVEPKRKSLGGGEKRGGDGPF